MTKKASQTTKPQAPPQTPTPDLTPVAKPTPKVLTPELLAQLKAAGSIDAGLKLLQPDRGARRVPENVTYQIGITSEPLPQARGASNKVVMAAVQLDRPFTVADVVSALPDVKSSKYWFGRLVKSGHFVPMETAVTE